MGDDERSRRDELRAIVSQEHRRLDDLFREVDAAFADLRDPAAVADAFAALCEELDVHFDQEDRLYYAPIAALRPELAPQVRAISDAHRGFRDELAAIRDALARGELAPSHSRIAALAEAFHRHEALEEQLLQRIEATLQPVPAGDSR